MLLLGALFSFTRVAFAQSADLAIVHVTIINPSAGKPQPDMTIVIRGRNIVSVSLSKDLKLSPSAKVINGTGKFAIPGLWDMHSHFRDAARDLKMDVANGVLGIRNMGGVAKAMGSRGMRTSRLLTKQRNWTCHS